MKTNLILVDMASAWSVNGVMRFLQELINGMRVDRSYQIVWIRFLHQFSPDIIKEKHKGFICIYIPLPTDMQSFFKKHEIRHMIWQKGLQSISQVCGLGEKVIIHLHTLNLMEFALYVRERITCKIISHIHCIPWKGLYNNHPERFNHLYEKYYILHDYHHPADYIFREYEWKTYTESDCVVCVTECALHFIQSACPNATPNIHVIKNGIRDIGNYHYFKNNNKIRCLFVGNSTPSKGIRFILKALEIVKMQHDVCLTIVGSYSRECQRVIYTKHPFLDIEFTGKIDMLQLRDLYKEADIGIIGSLQEQCSYAAIEMMMFGLPIISTDVDGLSELFIDNVDALIVPTHFHPQGGLQVDFVKMSDSILSLIENPALRKRIGQNARHTYKNNYTAKKMTLAIKNIYETI